MWALGETAVKKTTVQLQYSVNTDTQTRQKNARFCAQLYLGSLLLAQ